MFIRPNRLVRLIATVVVMAFSFESILWANPDITRARSLSTLQIWSKVAYPTESDYFEVALKWVLARVDDIGACNVPITIPPGVLPEGVSAQISFKEHEKYPGRDRDGNITHWVLPCTLTHGGVTWQCQAVVTADEEKDFYLRRSQKGYKPPRDYTPASNIPENSLLRILDCVERLFEHNSFAKDEAFSGIDDESDYPENDYLSEDNVNAALNALVALGLLHSASDAWGYPRVYMISDEYERVSSETKERIKQMLKTVSFNPGMDVLSGIAGEVNQLLEEDAFKIVTVKRKHFTAITALCRSGFVSTAEQQACGGLKFITDSNLQSRNEKALKENAKALATETDQACANSGNGFRGGTTVIISDGRQTREEILKEWASYLANHNEGFLGGEYIVVCNSGATETDMNVIAKSAFKNDSKLAKRGLVPAAGRSEDNGGYPIHLWNLEATGVVQLIQNIFGEGKVKVVMEGFGHAGFSYVETLIRKLPDTASVIGIGSGKTNKAIFMSDGLDAHLLLDIINGVRSQKKDGDEDGVEWLLRDKDRTGNSLTRVFARPSLFDNRSRLFAESKIDILKKGNADVIILANPKWKEKPASERQEFIEAITQSSGSTLVRYPNDPPTIVITIVPDMLTRSQRDLLSKRNIDVYELPLTNLGTLIAAREETVVHSSIQNMQLHVTSDISESVACLMDSLLKKRNILRGRSEHRVEVPMCGMACETANQIRLRELMLWESLDEEIRSLTNCSIKEWLEKKTTDDISIISRVRRRVGRNPEKGYLEPVIEQIIYNISMGRSKAFSFVKAVTDIARQDIIFALPIKHEMFEDPPDREQTALSAQSRRTSMEETIITAIEKGDVMERRIAAYNATFLIVKSAKLMKLLLDRVNNDPNYQVRANCAKALGCNYFNATESYKKKIINALITALRDRNDEVIMWAGWGLVNNKINLNRMQEELSRAVKIKAKEVEIAEKTKAQKGSSQTPRLDLGNMYFDIANICTLLHLKSKEPRFLDKAKRSYTMTRKIFTKFAEDKLAILPAKMQLHLAKSCARSGNKREAIKEYLRVVDFETFKHIVESVYAKSAPGETTVHASSFIHARYRPEAMTGIMDIYRPQYAAVSRKSVTKLCDFLDTLKSDGEFRVSGEPNKNWEDLKAMLSRVKNSYRKELSHYQNKYLALFFLYASVADTSTWIKSWGEKIEKYAQRKRIEGYPWEKKVEEYIRNLKIEEEAWRLNRERNVRNRTRRFAWPKMKVEKYAFGENRSENYRILNFQKLLESLLIDQILTDETGCDRSEEDIIASVSSRCAGRKVKLEHFAEIMQIFQSFGIIDNSPASNAKVRSAIQSYTHKRKKKSPAPKAKVKNKMITKVNGDPAKKRYRGTSLFERGRGQRRMKRVPARLDRTHRRGRQTKRRRKDDGITTIPLLFAYMGTVIDVLAMYIGLSTNNMLIFALALSVPFLYTTAYCAYLTFYKPSYTLARLTQGRSLDVESVRLSPEPTIDVSGSEGRASDTALQTVPPVQDRIFDGNIDNQPIWSRVPPESRSDLIGDLTDQKVLATNLLGDVLSLLAAKKIVFATTDTLGGLQSARISEMFDALEDLRLNPNYAGFFKDREIVKVREPAAKLPGKLEQYVEDDYLVFTFASNSERNELKALDSRIHRTFIGDKGFPEDAYFPIPEILTIVLGRLLRPEIMNELLGKINELGIMDIEEGKDGALLVSLLIPDSEKHDYREVIKKYAALVRLLRDA